MTSTTTRGVFASTEQFPGRWILVASFTLLTFSSGVGFYGLAVYLQAFSRELGWSVSSISLATTFFFLVGGVSGLSIAKFIAKRDVRIMIVAGAIVATGSLFCMRFVNERWQLFVVYGTFALGWSASGVGPVTTVVTRWFHAKRASAIAIATTGLSAGGIFIAPLIKWILDEQGIRDGSAWLALIWFVGTVPITVLFMRPFPHAYGWRPDGARVEPGEQPVVTGTPLAEAVRTRFFIAVTVAFVFTFGAQVGGVQQLVKLIEERTDRGTATFATVVLSLFAILGRFGGSRIIAKTDMTRFTIGITAVQGFSLIFVAVSDTRVPLLISVACFGLTIGVILMMQSLLFAQRFGVLDYPRIVARHGLISFTGTAAGPILLGWLYDNAGGYRASYLAAGVCSLIGVVFFSLAGPATTGEQ